MDTFIVTCEHGGNRIPAPYRQLFREQRALLDSHRGWDPGALVMAEGTRQCLAGAAGGFDGEPPGDRSQSLDRSPATLFGGDTRRAGRDARTDRRALLPAPSRAGRRPCHASRFARRSRDPHLVSQLHPGIGWQRCAAPTSVCSMTPGGGGRSRYVPAGRNRSRHGSRRFAYAAITPIAGKDDGLTSHLRRRFAQSDYVGIELEVNQSAGVRRGPALDGVAARADRFLAHGMCPLNAPRE